MYCFVLIDLVVQSQILLGCQCTHIYYIYIAKKWYPSLIMYSIDATFANGFGKMVNDATGILANCAMKIVYVNKEPWPCLFACRDIAEGEELRYDYGVSNLPWRKKVFNSFCVQSNITSCNLHIYCKQNIE